MREIGEVIKINEYNQALLRVTRTPSCNGCKACSMGRDDRKYIDIFVDNTLNAKIGDSIQIDMDTPDVLRAAFIAYGFPLIVMIASILLSYYLIFPQNQKIAGIVGIAAMLLSFLTIRLNEDKIRNSKKFLPKMIDIIKDDGLL